MSSGRMYFMFLTEEYGIGLSVNVKQSQRDVETI